MDPRRHIFKELRKFLKRYLSDSLVRELSKEVVADILEQETNNLQASEDYSIQIYDLVNTIISFSCKKLSDNNTLYLLIDLGNFSIEKGLFDLAEYINWKIIERTSKDPKLKNIRAHALLSIGDICSRKADWQRALINYNKAKKIFEAEKDFASLGKTENYIGVLYGAQGKVDKAEKHLLKGLSYLNPRKDKMIIATIEGNLATTCEIKHEFDDVYSHYQRALTIFKEFNDIQNQATVLHNLGMLFYNQNQNKRAMAKFDKSIELAKKASLLPLLAINYSSMAHIHFDLEDYDLAWEYAERSMVLSVKNDDKLTIADIYKIKGNIKRISADYRQAEYYLLSSLRINDDLKNDLNYAETCIALGILYKQMDTGDNAMSYFMTAKKYFSKLGNTKRCEEIDAHIRE